MFYYLNNTVIRNQIISIRHCILVVSFFFYEQANVPTRSLREIVLSPCISHMTKSIFRVTAMHLTLFSADKFLHKDRNRDTGRERNRHTVVHPSANPSIDTARSSARLKVYGAVLDAGEHFHDIRLRDHTLLHFR